jgi:S-DNA-T family DNA segregation ATPase FtsK/SpoIIIE
MAKNIIRNTDRSKEQKPSSLSSLFNTKIDFNYNNLAQNERFQFVVGVLLMLFALFMFIAFASHLFTGNADQSEVATDITSLEETSKKTKNFFGVFGAKLADFLMFRLFGWAAFLLVPVSFLTGFKISFKKELYPLEDLTWQVIFYLFWISSFLGFFVFMFDSFSSLGSVCGGIGYYLNEFLYKIIGWASILIIIFAFLTFVVSYYKIDLVEYFTGSMNVKDYEGTEDSEEAVDNIPEEATVEPTPLPVTKAVSEDEIGSLTTPIAPVIPPVVPPIPPIIEDEDEIGTPEVKEDSIALVIKETVEEPEPVEEIGKEETEEQALNEESELIKRLGRYDPKLDLPDYRYPTVDLLKTYDMGKPKVSQEELEENKVTIVRTLANYGIKIAEIDATIGPTVTLYEIIPEAGVRISKIKNLEDDIALSLAALGIRIIAPIPGKGTIGIEVPNKNREMVPVKQVIWSEKFQRSNFELPIVLGKTISNEIFMTDLAKMPHLLMAGATGQGKSVGLNMILTSLLFKKHPAELKFVLVDPKKVELTLFNKIERHFLAMLPDAAEAIITDTKKVVNTLNSLCIEMDNRYNLLKEAGCRNLKEYNTKFIERRLNPEKGHKFMPYIVLVIDELADLMMTAGKDVEQPIARLAQLARAIGIHLVVATQRPSVNVITGTIKANFPARLSFKVTSKIDSRTILDTGGAEQLVGRGDMLLSMDSEIIRLQCAFVDTPEVEDVCDFIGEQKAYDSAYILPEFEGDSDGGNEKGDVDLKNRDSFFDEAARLIVTHQQGSTSLIQRRLKLGYNRAGRLIDQLEAAGIVGAFEGSKAREVLIKDMEHLEELLRSL